MSGGGIYISVISITAIFAFLNILIFVWQQLVNHQVPQPYLDLTTQSQDEVFHVRQARVYCRRDFAIWDPKITTPPGLYLFSWILQNIRSDCETAQLRTHNTLFLSIVFICAFLYRASSRLVTGWGNPRSASLPESGLLADAHTALNIALFPPLFFFSALYYTDIISTAIVLLFLVAFKARHSLARHLSAFSASALLLVSCAVPIGYPLILSAHPSLTFVGFAFLLLGAFKYTEKRELIVSVCLAGLGTSALWFRQTNVFWVTAFPVGLALVDHLRLNGCYAGDQTSSSLIQHGIESGVLYDPILNPSSLSFNGIFKVMASLPAAAAGSLISLRSSKIHQLGLLVGTLRYIVPLVFFVSFVAWNGGVVLGDKSNHVATIHMAQMLYIWPYIAFFSFPILFPYAAEMIFSVKELYHNRTSRPRMQSVSELNIACLVGLLAFGIGIAHTNTIIHPFTLADNRHYVFYVFRFIRIYPVTRYLAVPIYMICGWMVLCALSMGEAFNKKSKPLKPKHVGRHAEDRNPQHSDAYQTAQEQANQSHEPPNHISFVLIWIITCVACLATAPLVEPRYFILPWIIWRLHVTSASDVGNTSKQKPQDGNKTPRYITSERLRLYLETIWFLVINGATGNIFLNWGYEWPQEPGRIQRFMW